MGLEAMIFSWMDYQDKQNWLANKTMEWIWETFSQNWGNNSQIFTHAMFLNTYMSPDEFCWEPNNCGFYADPIENDRSLKTYNVDEWASIMNNHVMNMKKVYKSN